MPIIRPDSEKSETLENHQAGVEGLAIAVIETGLSDLKHESTHTTSAIKFFKSSPDILEYWLAAASHKGKRHLDIEVAKRKLYETACKAEETFLRSKQLQRKSRQRA